MQHRWWRGFAFLATVGALFAAVALGGCGGGGGGGGAPPTPPPPTAQPGELNLTIQSVDVPATGAPSVTFKVTDKSGNPIDLIQEIKNGAASPAVAPRTTAPRFMLAQLQDSGDYLSAYERSIAGKPFIPEEGAAEQQPALPSANQAIADAAPTADPDLSARLVSQGSGVFKYTFSAAPTRTDLDRAKTWTAGMWATRTLATANDPGHPANSTFNFVPNGGTAQKLEEVKDSACNVCHGLLEAHDRRTGTQLCITCHSPQTTDPETGNTVNFKVMVHKIHRGSSLPSVVSGGKYEIVGFAPGNPATLPASAVQDFSDVAFPRSIDDCTACHQGANADRWNTAPSEAACTSCHDNNVFATAGSGPTTVCAVGVTAPCRHPVDITPGTACTNCHTPDEVKTVHTNQVAVQSAKFKYEITSVSLGADRKPVVQFHVVDPTNNNKPYVINASGGGTVDPPWAFPTVTPPTPGSGSSRLFVDIGWPSEEYTNVGSGTLTGGNPSPGQAVQIDALATATPVSGQAGVFQVTSPTAVPAGSSFTVALEGHPAFQVNPTTFLRLTVTNDVKYFDASGAANGPARRVVVATAKCNACHSLLTAHGSNRTGTTQVCAVCHNPDATDEGQRLASQSASSPPPLKPEAPIDFKVLIHAVHGDRVRQNPFVVIGFGGSTNTFPVGFPNDPGNCLICHQGTTFVPPLPAVAHDTTVDTGADVANPADNTRIPKTIAVCTACHDRVHFDNTAGLGLCNATATGDCNHSGGPQANDQNCQLCHGTGAGAVAPVDKVHPVAEPAAVTTQ